MKTAVIVCPGSNCDRDAAVAIERVTGTAPAMVWHGEPSLPEGRDLIMVPGGFSYGDYLHSGAIASAITLIDRGMDAAILWAYTVEHESGVSIRDMHEDPDRALNNLFGIPHYDTGDGRDRP